MRLCEYYTNDGYNSSLNAAENGHLEVVREIHNHVASVHFLVNMQIVVTQKEP
jgi:hypothetical protein